MNSTEASTEVFYDELASQYHLISVDWDGAVKRQGKILDSVLRKLDSKQKHLKILDCSCGIGTQAIGLALKGHHVFASDLSSKSVERAKKEASRLSVEMNFGVADFRNLESAVPGTFDAVISCDNSVPHLLTDKDLKLAFENMYQKIKPGGSLLISVRDYEQICKDRATGMPPRKFKDAQGTRIYMQTWDWNASGDAYELELFLLKQSENKWMTDSFKTTYRAWHREALVSKLEETGFTNVQWIVPEDSGYYQPIITASRNEATR